MRSAGRDLGTFSPFNLLLRWEHEICGATSIPVADRNSVYVYCEHGYIFAFNQAATDERRLRWKKHIEDPIHSVLLAVPGGVLFDPDMDHLEAVAAATGETLWKRELKAKGPRKKSFVPANIYDARVQQPLIYVLDAHGLYTLDLCTGKEKKFYGAYREWNYILVDQQNLYLAGRDEGTVEIVLPRKYGPGPEWIYQCGAPLKVAPVMNSHSIFCFSYDGCLHKIDRETGQLLGYAHLGVYPSESPLLKGSVLYLVTDEGDLQAIDLRRFAGPSIEEGTREIAPQDCLWQMHASKGRLGSAISMGEALFVAGDNGLLYGLDAATGKIFWQNDLRVPRLASLCTSENTLIASILGKVACFAPPPGFDQQASVRLVDAPAIVKEKPIFQRGPEAGSASSEISTPVNVNLMLRDPGLPRIIQFCSLPALPAGELAVQLPYIYLGCESGELIAIDWEAQAALWQAQIGGLCRGSPQIADRTLFANTDREVFAFEIETGRRIWQRPCLGSIRVDVLLAGDALFYLSEAGQMLCLDAATGNTRWQSQLEKPGFGLACSTDGLLFLGVEGGVQAMAVQDGRQLWFSPTANQVASPIVYAAGCLFLGCRDQRLYAIAADSGELDWVYKTRDEIRVPPAFSPDGCVYAASMDQFLYALESRTGELQWRFKFDQLPLGRINLTSKTVYLGTQVGPLYAIERLQGRLLWKHDLGNVKLKTAPLVAGENLFAATTDGRLLSVLLNER